MAGQRPGGANGRGGFYPSSVTSNNAVAVTFDLNTNSLLTVLVSGNGIATPNLGGQMLRVGRRYTLLATAAEGCQLSPA